MYNFCNGIICQQISKSIKAVLCICIALALTISKLLTFHIFYLQKVGQGHRVQIIIKTYKIRPFIFAIALAICLDTNVSHFTFKKQVKVMEYIFSKLFFDDKFQNLQQSSDAFCANTNNIVSNLYHQKQANVVEYNFHNEAIRWQISKSTTIVLCIFTPALTISEILTFHIFDLQKSRSRSLSKNFAMRPFDGKYLSQQKSAHEFVCASSINFRDIV